MISTEVWRDPLVQRLIRQNGGKPPEAAIEKHVQDCLREAYQDRLPINVELIASVLGVKRRVAAYPFAGRIYAEPSGQLVMDLNAGDSDRRRRFSCAHELIHPAFPGFKREARYRLDLTTGSPRSNRSEEESLCDLGASMMLMPATLVSSQYRIKQDGLAALEQLANDAQVSLEAAGNRLVKLSDHPAAFIVLEVGYKPADRGALRKGQTPEQKLRISYAVVNRLRVFMPPYKSVEPNSLYAKAIGEGRVVEGRSALPGVSGSNDRYRVQAKQYSRFDGDNEICRILALAIED